MNNLISHSQLSADISPESEERFRMLFNSIDEGFCVCEMIFDDEGKPFDYRFLEINRTFEKQTGLENALGKTARQLLPDLEPHWFEIYGRVVQTGEPVRFVNGSDVMNRWFDVYAFRIGKPEEQTFAVLFTDITERRRAEENQKLLLEISEKIRLAENADDLLFDISKSVGEHLRVRRCLFNEIDLERDLEIVHRDYCRGVQSAAGNHRISEYSPVTTAEMRAGRTVVNRDSENDPRTAEFYERTYAPDGDRAYVAVPLMRDGRWVASLCVSDNRPRNWSEQEIGLLEAIAERAWLTVEKLRDAALLRESEERFSKAFNAAPHLMTITNLEDGRYLSVNDSVLRATGYTREEMIGRTADELNIFVKPEGRAKVLDAFERGAARDLEVKVRTKEGEIRLLKLSADIINVEGEKCILTSSVDITESERAEAILRESEERFRQLSDSAPVLIWLYDTEGCEYVNRQYLDFVGVSALDDVRGIDWAQFVHPDDYDRYVNGFFKAFERRDVFTAQFRFRRYDGEYRWMTTTGVPRFSVSGDFLGYVGSTVDIHALKKAEEKTRESEERFRNMADNAPVMVWVTEPDATCTYLSQSWYEFTGQTPETGLGFGWLDAVHPDDHEMSGKIFLAANEKREPFRLEYRLRRKDGAYRWAIDSAQPRLGAGGEFLGYIGSVIDITERKLAEEFIRESEESYRILAETASDAIIRINADSTIQFVNTAAERIFGYAAPEMLGQSLMMLMPEEMSERHHTGLRRYLQTGRRELNWESLEVSARHKDGHDFPLEISFGEYHRDDARFFIAIARDISERRRAEALLRESEERFAKAFNSSPLVVTITSLKTGKLVEVNETFVNMTGYSREEAIGQTTAELNLWVRDSDRLAELELVQSKGQIRSREYHFRMKDGREIVGLLSAELLEIGGEPCALTVIQDITERNLAEELIRDSEEKFRNLANSISQFAWMTDASGYIFWYNQRWFEYTGTTLEEMQGWGWQKVHHPDEIERVTEKFKQHLASGEIWEDTFPLRSRSGEYRWFLSRAVPIRDENGQIVRWIGTNTDIEEVRQARLQAEQANRLKDEFLATVSHELRTPLNAILGWSNMLQSNKADDEMRNRAVEVIYRNAKSQAQLIEDLLDVSRIITGKMRIEPHPVGFAPIIRAAADTIRPAAAAKSIEIETDVECEPCLIGGDAQRLQQIVWNLLSNAVKFTPEGGRVRVLLENAGSHARLTVSDTGKGIEPEFLPFMFERFRQEDSSSTRRHGGLGLGLAIVRHLVELHGGRIFADSAGVNLGSTFTIELPLAFTGEKQTRRSARNLRETLSDGFRGKREVKKLKGIRVLLVDDELDTLEMLDTALSGSGAEVRTASSAPDAFEIFKGWQPDVLVSDIAMPEEDGYSLIKKVRKLRDEEGAFVPAIAMTAYVRTEDKMRVLASGFQSYVPKPAEPSELIAVISDITSQNRRQN